MKPELAAAWELVSDPDPVNGTGGALGSIGLTVGTDGACPGNPGPAGWAWVDEHGRYRCRGLAAGTNQIAELSALLDALEDHRDVRELVIQLDSTYARDCATIWRPNWELNGMRNAKKKPVANPAIILAIWRELDARSVPPRFEKVPGHDPGNRYPLNTAADILADRAAQDAKAGRPSDRRGTIELAAVKPRRT